MKPLSVASRLGLRCIVDADRYQSQRDESRDHRDPEYEFEVVARRQHQPDGDERPEESTDCVERLPQPERCAAQVRGREIGNERIARCSAYAFADAIDEPGRNEPSDAAGEWKDGLGEGSEALSRE